MYGRFVGITATGAGGAALAATGVGLNVLASIVTATTLFAAGLALWKLAPRFRNGR
jgi:hypothetical protein